MLHHQHQRTEKSFWYRSDEGLLDFLRVFPLPADHHSPSIGVVLRSHHLIKSVASQMFAAAAVLKIQEPLRAVAGLHLEESLGISQQISNENRQSILTLGAVGPLSEQLHRIHHVGSTSLVGRQDPIQLVLPALHHLHQSTSRVGGARDGPPHVQALASERLGVRPLQRRHRRRGACFRLPRQVRHWGVVLQHCFPHCKRLALLASGAQQ
mmetsp:Transcript_23039/g.55913  ORF Transcript_23039/g.55913 Transcript_23039/m.55913 type:complete len:210 (-) Transcript_23039:314-943(-)